MKKRDFLHLLCILIILLGTTTHLRAQIPSCAVVPPTDPCNYIQSPPIGWISTCELSYVPMPPVLAIWLGTIDNNWFNPGNWFNGMVPGAGNDVWVPSQPFAVNYPTIPMVAQAFCHNIWIRDGASILGNANLVISGLAYVERYVNHESWPHFVHCNWLDDSVPITWPCDIHYLSSPVPAAKDSTVEQDAVWRWSEPTQQWIWLHHLCSEMCWTPPIIWMPGTGYSVTANHYWWCNTTDCPLYLNPPSPWCDPPWKCQFYREWIDSTMNFGYIEYVSTPSMIPGLTYTVPPAGQYPPGWNLLGNPYPSAIDWFLSITNNVFINSACMWNDVTQSYIYVIGQNGFIPIIQGFMVQAMPGGGTVTFTEASRLHNNNVPLWKNEKSNFLRMKVTDEGGSYSDEAFILMDPAAENGMDRLDASKLGNGPAVPMIFSVLEDNSMLAVNTIRSAETNPEVAIHFKAGSEGTHTIQVTGIGSFDASVPLFLEDLYTGSFQDLRNNPVYQFEAGVSDGTARFILHFNPTGISSGQMGNINIYASGQTVCVDLPVSQNAKVFVYNMLGMEVISGDVVSGKTNKLTVPGSAGYYVVKVVSVNGVTAQKVFIH